MTLILLDFNRVWGDKFYERYHCGNWRVGAMQRTRRWACANETSVRS